MSYRSSPTPNTASNATVGHRFTLPQRSPSSGSAQPSTAAPRVSTLAALLCGALLACAPGDTNAPASAERAGTDQDHHQSNAAAEQAIWVRGSRMRGANGIHFGPSGKLWVASVVTPAVFALDAESGEVLERLGPQDHATAPDDLAFGPDGALYWTNISFGTIGKRAVDGTTSIIADLGPGVNPITFSDDGRLFVSQCFMDTRLFEVDPQGQREPRIIRDDLGPNCGLNGMDWGPDDRLYGPRWFRGEVVRIDVDTGGLETVATGFEVPAAVKFDSRGRLHVLDALAGEVVRVTGATREVVARLQPGLDNLAFDAEDQLYVSSFAEGAIWQVEGPAAGEVRVVSPAGVNMPGGVALVGDRLVIADFFALRTLDADSGEQLEVERDVIGFSQLGSSMSVHAAGGDLITSSWFDNQVRVWNPATRSVVASVSLPAPIDALRSSATGRILVSLWGRDGAGKVVSVDPEAPAEGVELASNLDGPAGLALVDTAHGEVLYIAERGSGRLLRRVLPSQEGSGTNEVADFASGFEGPEGLAVAGEHLYVVEAAAGRVSAVHLETGEKTTVAEDLALHVPSQGAFPDTMLFGGIAARTVGHQAQGNADHDADDAGGAAIELYVSGDRANVLYRLVHRP